MERMARPCGRSGRRVVRGLSEFTPQYKVARPWRSNTQANSVPRYCLWGISRKDAPFSVFRFGQRSRRYRFRGPVC